MNHSFVHIEYSTSHPGVERAEQAVANIKRMGESLSPTRTLAGMLLAAVVAAFVVVADQMMDTWADGHLLAAWVTLWAVAFAAARGAAMAPLARGVAMTSVALGVVFPQAARGKAIALATRGVTGSPAVRGVAVALAAWQGVAAVPEV